MIPDPLPFSLLLPDHQRSQQLLRRAVGSRAGRSLPRGGLQVRAAAFGDLWGDPGLGNGVIEGFRVWEADQAATLMNAAEQTLPPELRM